MLSAVVHAPSVVTMFFLAPRRTFLRGFGFRFFVMSTPLRCRAAFRFRPLLLVALCIGIVGFTGCATRPVTYKLRDSATTQIPALRHVIVAPIDAELAELTAGGVLEPREEWTSLAAKNLAEALVAETGFTPAATTAVADTHAEQEEVQALLRAITINRLSAFVPGAQPPFPATNGPLTYHTGALRQHAEALGADAVLFVFIRDSYATAGRKSLLALSVIGAAFTGVAIIPAMGSTAMSAALVDREGAVLWFNHSLGGHDPRKPEGARELIREILVGLPRRKT